MRSLPSTFTQSNSKTGLMMVNASLLGEKEFAEQCRMLVRLFSADDGHCGEPETYRDWAWKEVPKSPRHRCMGYLSLGPITRFEASADACSGRLANLEFHVVYCHTYGVPALYMIAGSLSGEPLIWDELRGFLPPELTAEKWHYITREAHPILGLPCLQVDPCMTCEWMSSLTCADIQDGSEKMYMLCWLTCLGTITGVEIPPQAFLQYQKTILQGY